MDQLRAIRYFIVTAEKGSFTQAAKHFNVPASSISRRIADLEQSLDAQLFSRTTRSLSLTEVGEQYYNQVRSVVQQLEQCDQAVRDYQSVPKGTLKITCMSGFAERELIPVLNLFSQAYPEITIDLELNDALSNLQRDDVDIAIRGGFVPDERVIALRLMTNEFIAAASQGYLAQYGVPSSTLSLRHHKGLYYKTPSGSTPWLSEIEGQWHNVSAPTVLSTNSGNWLIEKAIAGEGIIMLPRWVLALHIEAGELVELKFEHSLRVTQQQEMGVYMLYPQRSYASPKVKVAVDFIKQHFLQPQ
ncbi:transcriptional regulator LysR family [Vibrio astriarenae]|nr:transcriptional regulator LysR family [Vibrio sp. C7]